MKVFLDTNVIIAAHEWQEGVCAEVYEVVQRNHTLIISERVISESRRVLSDTFEIPDDVLDIFVDELRKADIAPETDTPYDVSLSDEDKDDPYILASAVAVDADVLVTGDKAFCSVDKDVPELEIRTPREFLDEYS